MCKRGISTDPPPVASYIDQAFVDYLRRHRVDPNVGGQAEQMLASHSAALVCVVGLAPGRAVYVYWSTPTVAELLQQCDECVVGNAQTATTLALELGSTEIGG